jgi:poly(3-hydroxybutyrate) depolymerase
MLYLFYELNHAAAMPWRAAAACSRVLWQTPANPFAATQVARSMAASLELFERLTRRYDKPEFGIDSTVVDGQKLPVVTETVWQRPFCRLLHFRKPEGPKQPKLLLVAPLSGHFATLLRDTVKEMLPHADVYVTDWEDASQVPASKGLFDLDDYIDYLFDMLAWLDEPVHVMAVCQPAVPVLAAVSLMSQRDDPLVPKSMILMGGPIDTRRNPTMVNEVALSRGLDWLARHAIVPVPFPNPGHGRDVYPGFLQLAGFTSMNLDRHMDAHREMYWHLVHDDHEPAEKHRQFYDEFLSVLDMTAEYYLQTVEEVFIRHALPNGTFTHRGEPVDPAAITRTALMTVEGEHDDISGVGQTEAAHDLCRNIPEARKRHHLQEGAGHYGVFNGRRFRTEIVPRIVEFIRASETAEPISSGGKPSSAEPPRTFMARLAAGRQLAAKAG